MKALDLQQIIVTYFFLLFSAIFLQFASGVEPMGQFVAFFIAALLVLFGLLFQNQVMSYPLIIAGLVAVVKNILSIIGTYTIYSLPALPVMIDVIFLGLLIGISAYFLDAYKKQKWEMMKSVAANKATLLFLVATLGVSSMGLMFPVAMMSFELGILPILLVTGGSFMLSIYFAMRKPFALQFGIIEFAYAFCLPVASIFAFHYFKRAVSQDVATVITLIIAALLVLLGAFKFKKSGMRYGLIMCGLTIGFLSAVDPFLGIPSVESLGILFYYICLIFFIFLFFVASYVLEAINKHGLQKIKSTAMSAFLLIFLGIIIGGWFAALSFVDMIIKGKTLM